MSVYSFARSVRSSLAACLPPSGCASLRAAWAPSGFVGGCASGLHAAILRFLRLSAARRRASAALARRMATAATSSRSARSVSWRSHFASSAARAASWRVRSATNARSRASVASHSSSSTSASRTSAPYSSVCEALRPRARACSTAHGSRVSGDSSRHWRQLTQRGVRQSFSIGSPATWWTRSSSRRPARAANFAAVITARPRRRWRARVARVRPPFARGRASVRRRR